jgi:hypothetical protein
MMARTTPPLRNFNFYLKSLFLFIDIRYKLLMGILILYIDKHIILKMKLIELNIILSPEGMLASQSD